MAKKATHSVIVCLSSFHPLALEQLKKILGVGGIEPNSIVLDPNKLPDAETISLPPAEVYVVDVSIGDMAIAWVRFIGQKAREARTVAVGEDFTEANAFPLLEAGVKGLLSYREAPAQLSRAIQSVSAGGYWVSRPLLSRFVDRILGQRNRPPAGSANLSSREHQVLDALLQNLSNKEIGNKLHISERTVKFHVSNLLSKFGVQRRADLILLWFQNSERASGTDCNTTP
jgi:DNA-binding NarL/FixJ family response regulator